MSLKYIDESYLPLYDFTS